MPLAEDKGMIQTVAPKRSVVVQRMHSPTAISVIWAGHGYHPPKPTSEVVPVSIIIVAHQIAWRRIPRKCLHDLLGQPLRRRMPGHRKPQQLSPPVTQNKKGKQPLKGQGRNHAEINRSNSSAWLHRNVLHSEMAVLGVGCCRAQWQLVLRALDVDAEVQICRQSSEIGHSSISNLTPCASGSCVPKLIVLVARRI